MAANIPIQYPSTRLQVDDAQPAFFRRKKVRNFFRSLFSHTLINLVGLCFLIPFLWMAVTSFKTDEDVFHTPIRWLPYDNVRVEVNGQQLPIYNVKTESGIKVLALLKIAEGIGTFIDPKRPAELLNYKLQQGPTKIAEPIMQVSFRWQNFIDAMNRGSRPGVGASFWVYFKNSLIIGKPRRFLLVSRPPGHPRRRTF